MISAGGALGGIFVSLIAPHLFVTFLEWNLGLGISYAVAAVVWLVGLRRSFRSQQATTPAHDPRPLGAARLVASAAAGIFMVAGLALVAYWQIDAALPDDDTILRDRNFYGRVTVNDVHSSKTHLHYRELRHGHVLHGRQFVSDGSAQTTALRKTTYYSETTGAGRAIQFFQSRPDMSVGVVGLGAGTLAAYDTQPGYRFTFYEINPVVIDIAKNKNYFTFWSDARGHKEIVAGDARLSFERQSPQAFDVLILDAFSGDAPPAHLLTREAFGVYQRHMKADGIIAVHITNHFVDLAPVVQAAADYYHYGVTRICTDDDSTHLLNHTDYMVLTRNEEFLKANPPVLREGLSPKIEPVVWTDHYSNLFQLLMFK